MSNQEYMIIIETNHWSLDEYNSNYLSFISKDPKKAISFIEKFNPKLFYNNNNMKSLFWGNSEDQFSVDEFYQEINNIYEKETILLCRREPNNEEDDGFTGFNYLKIFKFPID